MPILIASGYEFRLAGLSLTLNLRRHLHLVREVRISPRGILKQRGRTIFIFGAVVLVFVAITLALFIGYYAGLTRFVPNPQERGVFGDQFGGLSAFFSALAFTGVLYTLYLQVEQFRQKTKEERSRHARRVSAWLDHDYNIIVQNSGDEPVFDVKVLFCEEDGKLPDEEKISKRTICFGTVAPNSKEPSGYCDLHIPRPRAGPEFAQLQISFRDADQREWVRRPNGSLCEKQ